MGEETPGAAGLWIRVRANELAGCALGRDCVGLCCVRLGRVGLSWAALGFGWLSQRLDRAGSDWLIEVGRILAVLPP